MCLASISTLFWCELGSRPLSAHGLWNCQAHFMEIRQPRVLSSSVAPSPHGSVTFEWKDPCGDSLRFRRCRFKVQDMTVKSPGDDSSKSRGWRFEVQGMTVRSPGGDGFDTDLWTMSTLTGCLEAIYDAWHVSYFHWILSWIETSLRLPCTSSIILHSSFLISLFSAETYYQSASLILVRDHSVQVLYSSLTPFVRSLTILVSTLFLTSFFLSYILLFS